MAENVSHLVVEKKKLMSIIFSMCPSDLQASQSFEHYSISDKAMDYRILQMDEDQDRMYVGCKDHVLSMDINNITQGTLKVGRCLLFTSESLNIFCYYAGTSTCGILGLSQSQRNINTFGKSGMRDTCGFYCSR